MPPKRKADDDTDIIRTESDHRRATGTDEDDEIVEIEMMSSLSGDISYAIVTNGRDKTIVPRKRTKTVGGSFPFLDLPAEIRNMIYRYLVVSKNPKPIILDTSAWFPHGDIETAILSTNRQIFHEAGKIMYGENKCVVNIAEYVGGLSIRQDNPKSKLMTTKSLRSGRSVDMATSQGLIYEHVATRLKNVEFRVDIFNRKAFCRWHSVRVSREFRLLLERTFATLVIRHEQMMRDRERVIEEAELEGKETEETVETVETVSASNDQADIVKEKVKGNGKQNQKDKEIDNGMGWRVVITAADTSVLMLKKLIRPLVSKTVAGMVKSGDLKMIVNGHFPEGWEQIFKQLGKSRNFGHSSVQIDGGALKEEGFTFVENMHFYAQLARGTDMDTEGSENMDFEH